MKKQFLSWLFAAALLSCFSVAQASPVTPFTAGDVSVTKMGLAEGYPNSLFDKLTIDGSSGSINGSGEYSIASLLFQVGYNAYVPLTNTGSVSFDFDIGGTSGVLTIPYTIEINVADTLRLGIGQLSLTHGGYLYNIATQAVNFVNVGMSNPNRSATLLADVTVSAVPLPPAILLMLSGMGLLGFASRRKVQA